MRIILATVLVLSSLIGTCCTVCLLYGYLLRPCTNYGTWAVVWGFGDGEGLEQRVRSLMWLRACGLLRCRVILLDGGLNEEGQKLAHNLTRRWPDLECLNEPEW